MTHSFFTEYRHTLLNRSVCVCVTIWHYLTSEQIYLHDIWYNVTQSEAIPCLWNFQFPAINKANTADMQTSEMWTTLKPIMIFSIPVQAWTGPLGSRRLRLPELLENRHMKVARMSALCTGRL